jgi:hypothetical protein
MPLRHHFAAFSPEIAGPGQGLGATVGATGHGSNTMRYEVRYQVGGEEFSAEVDANDAASAASMVQDENLGSSEVFELIQVQLLDDMPDTLELPIETPSTS